MGTDEADDAAAYAQTELSGGIDCDYHDPFEAQGKVPRGTKLALPARTPSGPPSTY
jgi:hypothetical protein